MRETKFTGEVCFDACDNPTPARQIESIGILIAMRGLLEAARAEMKLRELDLIIGQQVLRLAANAQDVSGRGSDRTSFLRKYLVDGPCPLTPSTRAMIEAALETEDALRLSRAPHH